MSKPQLDRIEAKVDKLDTRLDKVDVRLEKYNAELEFHIARTNQVEDTLVNIVKHVEQVRGAGKLIGVLALIASIVTALWSFHG
jgi:uncharacterized membrane-anchored protein YhcB (DUF1043 family)